MCTVEKCKLLREVSGWGGGQKDTNKVEGHFTTEQSFHMNMGWKPRVFVRKDNVDTTADGTSVTQSITQSISLSRVRVARAFKVLTRRQVAAD